MFLPFSFDTLFLRKLYRLRYWKSDYFLHKSNYHSAKKIFHEESRNTNILLFSKLNFFYANKIKKYRNIRPLENQKPLHNTMLQQSPLAFHKMNRFLQLVFGHQHQHGWQCHLFVFLTSQLRYQEKEEDHYPVLSGWDQHRKVQGSAIVSWFRFQMIQERRDSIHDWN